MKVFAILFVLLFAIQSRGATLEKRLSETESKMGDPIFIRIIKDESILEVWIKPAGKGEFIYLAGYPICYFSGGLGPKQKVGDRKAPEGFYAFGLNQLNPYSKFHKSFNLGYPNAFDRAQGYTGNYLMVHGACLSDGCYAMGNAQIDEIYNISEAALKAGQPFIRVHALPFRLTDKKLNHYKNHDWIDFWKMLQPIYNHFETYKIPPDVIVKDNRYQINLNDN